MEVDQHHFRKQLLTILKHISTASFVSFDLEMSGINKRATFGTESNSRDGKPTLQQMYEETKEAAETFQTLQVGITCVEEDQEKEYYLARPYNFNLSPLFFRDNIMKDRFPERKIVFSSSACDFLQNAGFNIGKVFTDGIYYLSHKEEVDTRRNFKRRNDQQTKRPDVVIQPTDTVALEFYRKARKTISTWVNDPKPSNPFVNVGDPSGPLNGYQRRLVHQLVANEFPGYRSFARNEQSFIQIEKIDLKKEADKQRDKLSHFNEDVAKQIGLRWIFDALTGGDLDGISTKWFSEESDAKPELTQENVNREFNEVKLALKTKNHIIVGHNLFMDLIYLYKTFVGSLPSRVEEFQEEINLRIPFIIDTKYLATHGDGSMSKREGLQDLLEPFRKNHIPLIVLHEQHTSYGIAIGKSHEAGFDSWMTAELFVKLSAKLYADRKQLGDVFDAESDCDSVIDDVGYSGDDDETGGALLGPLTNGLAQVSVKDNHPPEWHAKQLNPYSVLDGLGENLSNDDTELHPKQWIPSFASSFWDIYVNRLRVNAVEGGICVLDEARIELSESDWSR